VLLTLFALGHNVMRAIELSGEQERRDGKSTSFQVAGSPFVG